VLTDLGSETWLLAPRGLVHAMPAGGARGPTVIPWDIRSLLDDTEPRGEDKATRLWQRLGAALSVAAIDRGRYPDYLVLLYMDSFASELLPRSAVESNVRCPFAGLWFKPPRPLGWSFRDVAKRVIRWGRRYQILQSPLFTTILLLDRTGSDHLTGCGRPALVEVPEFSNNSLPDHEPALVREIQSRAAGRHIYALVGSLEARKGIHAFLEAAATAPSDEWYFVMAGKTAWSTLDSDTRRTLSDVSAVPQDRLFFIDTWLEDKTLNAIVASSRLLHACYDAWPYSSNMLCKAAAFRVPVTSMDYGYLGRTVRNYSLGITISDKGKLPGLFRPGFAESIHRLTASGAFISGCEAYEADNGPPALARALRSGLPVPMIGGQPVEGAHASP